MKNEKAPHKAEGIGKSGDGNATMPEPPRDGNMAEDQRSRILAWPRRNELSKSGYEIENHLAWEVGPKGKRHRVGRYVLRGDDRG